MQATPSQTVGPFFALGMNRMLVADLAGPGVEGKKITIRGRVLDADGRPVPDAVIETWQANAHGKYAHSEDVQAKPLQPGFTGFGRVATDDEGAFALTTIMPGRVPGRGNSLQAPHIAVSVFMRGLLRQYVSRIYFEGEPGNADDPVLQLVEPERRHTLIARRVPQRDGEFEWDVRCSGENETVFFEY